MNKINLTHICDTFLFPLALLCCSSSAFSFNICTLDGSTTYTDAPCPPGAHSEVFTKQVIPPSNPTSAKKHSLSDQNTQMQLRKLQQKKMNEEKKHERERRALAKQIKKEKDQRFKCNELNLKQKEARRHQSEVRLKGNSLAMEKAQLKMQQAENKYAHFCKP